MRNKLLPMVVGLALLGGVAAAPADAGVHVSLGFGFPVFAPVHPYPYAPPPVYVAPPPVYLPPPVVYYGGPRYYPYRGHHHGWGHYKKHRRHHHRH